MPPPLEDNSDAESTGGSIPFQANNSPKPQDDADDVGDGSNNGNEDEDEDDGDEEEGLYVVETILGHDFLKDGTLLLQVKWKGYDDPADQTMESEENLLEGAKEVVEEYYKTQGGRPEKPAPAPRKRKSMGEGKASQKHTEPKKQRKPSSQPEEDDGMDNEHWVPSKGKNWENEVALVDTVMKDDKIGGLCGYVHWKNGRKSKVAIETCKEKFPRKLCDFYEQHLVFKE